jgi:hypothetical protein
MFEYFVFITSKTAGLTEKYIEHKVCVYFVYIGNNFCLLWGRGGGGARLRMLGN